MLLASDDVRAVEFRTPQWSRVHASGEVDAFLDRIAAQLRRSPGALRPGRPGRPRPGLTAQAVRTWRLPTAGRLDRSYVVAAVDALLERVARCLESGGGLTAAEVRDLMPPRATWWRPGCDENATDALLDRLERQLAGRHRD